MRRAKRLLCLGLAASLTLWAALAEGELTPEAGEAEGQAVVQTQEALGTQETDTEEPPAEPTEEAPAEPTEVIPSEETPAEPAEETSTEETPAEPSEETSTEETPAEPAEETSTEETPAEPSEETSTEETPAEPAEETPTEETPAEPAEEIPAEEPPVEEAPTEPAEQTPLEETPAENLPAEPNEQPPVEETPVEPIEQPPVEEMPIEPIEQPPVEEMPIVAEQGLVVWLVSPEGLGPVDNVYAIDAAQYSEIALAWSCTSVCDGFAVTVTGPDGSAIHDAVQVEAALTLSVAELAAGRYTVSITALLSGEGVAWSQLSFELIQSAQEGGFPGGFPRGFFGGFSGSFGRGAGAQMAEVEQGFKVTAGKALTSAHNSGNKDMRLYGAVSLELEEAGMTELTLGGEALGITLDDGAAVFTAQLDGATLALTPEAKGETWVLNGLAMKTLARSGVEALLLRLGDEAVTLPTQPALTGRIYAGLRAAGYASSDYEYRVSAEGVRLSVDGAAYIVNREGELEAEGSEGQ